MHAQHKSPASKPVNRTCACSQNGLSTEIISNLLKSIEAENGELDSTKISFLTAAFRSVHFSKNLAAHEAQSIGVTGHTLHNH